MRHHNAAITATANEEESPLARLKVMDAAAQEQLAEAFFKFEKSKTTGYSPIQSRHDADRAVKAAVAIATHMPIYKSGPENLTMDTMSRLLKAYTETPPFFKLEYNAVEKPFILWARDHALTSDGPKETNSSKFKFGIIDHALDGKERQVIARMFLDHEQARGNPHQLSAQSASHLLDSLVNPTPWSRTVRTIGALQRKVEKKLDTQRSLEPESSMTSLINWLHNQPNLSTEVLARVAEARRPTTYRSYAPDYDRFF